MTPTKTTDRKNNRAYLKNLTPFQNTEPMFPQIKGGIFSRFGQGEPSFFTAQKSHSEIRGFRLGALGEMHFFNRMTIKDA